MVDVLILSNGLMEEMMAWDILFTLKVLSGIFTG
jgi:hypothetical protein